MSTAPGFTRLPFQQSIEVVAVVELIAGCVHQLATRSGTEPKRPETSCQGGTCSADGLEMTRTPLDNISIVGSLLEDG